MLGQFETFFKRAWVLLSLWSSKTQQESLWKDMPSVAQRQLVAAQLVSEITVRKVGGRTVVLLWATVAL